MPPLVLNPTSDVTLGNITYLRQRIHELLDGYISEYIAIDYDEWAQVQVYEVTGFHDAAFQVYPLSV
jgi:hypothetical protein